MQKILALTKACNKIINTLHTYAAAFVRGSGDRGDSSILLLGHEGRKANVPVGTKKGTEDDVAHERKGSLYNKINY